MALKTKRRTFKEVSAEAYAKGRDEGYATAARQYQEVQQRLQACLDKGIWSRLTGLFKGGRHDL
jgi:flagellar biosynthesis/type III secretory pathway protein FliH